MNKKIPLSVIIPVKNEEVNIKECLNSVESADELLVIDSQSTDTTVQIAKDHGAEVKQFYYDGGWPKKKNWAINNINFRNDWILILDADERVTESLKSEIVKVIQQDDIKGYYIRWKFIFLGKWMKHSWNHGWILRLFQKGYGEYENLGLTDEGGWDNEVHENIIVNGKTDKLTSYLLHETNQSLSFWIKKQNEFSDWNAKRRYIETEIKNTDSILDIISSDPLKRRRVLKKIYLRIPFKPLFMFFYLYFFKLGFLDGREGLYFCALRSTHELNTSAKLYELKKCVK